MLPNLSLRVGIPDDQTSHAASGRLSEVLGLAHDSVNHFLLRESYEPQDLYQEAMAWVSYVW